MYVLYFFYTLDMDKWLTGNRYPGILQMHWQPWTFDLHDAVSTMKGDLFLYLK